MKKGRIVMPAPRTLQIGPDGGRCPSRTRHAGDKKVQTYHVHSVCELDTGNTVTMQSHLLPPEQALARGDLEQLHRLKLRRQHAAVRQHAQHRAVLRRVRPEPLGLLSAQQLLLRTPITSDV